MRIKLLLAVFLITLTLHSQVSVSYIEKIYTANDNYCKIAGFSPDASYILLTTKENNGLRKLDISSKQITQISESKGAGYNCIISNDGKYITYTQTLEQANGNTHKSQLCYNLKNNKHTIPFVLGNYILNQNANNKIISVLNIYPSRLRKQSLPAIALNNNLQLIIAHGLETKILSPNGKDQSYLWVQLSPNKKNVCYNVAAKGCYVCDLEGNNIQFISREYIDAKWLNNNQIIATEYFTDDYNSSVSRIVAYSLDGKKQILSRDYKTEINQYPCTNKKKIAYSNGNGDFFIIHLN